MSQADTPGDKSPWQPPQYNYEVGTKAKPHDPFRRAMAFFPLAFLPAALLATTRASAKLRPQVFGGSIVVFGGITYYMFLSDNG